MMKKTPKRTHPVITEILNRISPVEKAKISTKMNIAALIDDAMQEKGGVKKT